MNFTMNGQMVPVPEGLWNPFALPAELALPDGLFPSPYGSGSIQATPYQTSGPITPAESTAQPTMEVLPPSASMKYQPHRHTIMDSQDFHPSFLQQSASLSATAQPPSFQQQNSSLCATDFASLYQSQSTIQPAFIFPTAFGQEMSSQPATALPPSAFMPFQPYQELTLPEGLSYPPWIQNNQTTSNARKILKGEDTQEHSEESEESMEEDDMLDKICEDEIDYYHQLQHKLHRCLKQITLLDNALDQHQERSRRAKARAQPVFSYSSQLPILTLERVRGMFVTYVEMMEDKIEEQEDKLDSLGALDML